MASAGSASKALKQKFSVPGKEGWQTNQQIARDFRGTGGNSAPLVPVVTLPTGKTVSSPGVRADLRRLEVRIEQALPGTRLAGYSSTGDHAFVSRSLLAFVPIVMAIVSIMTTFLIVWGLTTITDVSPIVQFLVALIGLGVAIDYSLLVVVRWREERAHGRVGDEAIHRAMATAGRAVVFSGTTVAIGLLALIALPLPFLRSVGYGGMLIPLVSVLVALTLLPVVLSKAGRRLDWPHKRTDDKASRAWTSWAQGVVHRRWFAAAGAALVLAALVLAATSLQPGLPNADTIAKRGDAKQGLMALERSGIGPGALLPNEVLTDGTPPAKVAAALRSVDGVHGAVAPAGTAWRHGQGALVEAFTRADGSSNAGRDTLDRIRTVAHEAG